MNNHRTLLSFLFAATAACAAEPADDPADDAAEPDAGMIDEDEWSEIAIAAPDHLRLQVTLPGELAVTITREGEAAQGPVTIAIADLPAGVTAEPITIADGETAGVLTVVASDLAALAAPAPITIVATTADLESKAASAITVVGLPGMYDPTFSDDGRDVRTLTEGRSETLLRVLPAPDGGFIAIGRDNSTPERLTLLRYDAAGQALDPISIPNGFGTLVDAAIDPQDRVVVILDSVNGTFVTRILANGATDYDFNKGGYLHAAKCSSVAADAQGRIYVGCGHEGATAEVLRFGVDGVLDSSFDLDGRASTGVATATVRLTLDGQDRPIVVGTHSGIPVEQSMWRFAEDGGLTVTVALDAEWSWDYIQDVVHAGGRTYASFSGVWSSQVVAIAADGPDASFGTGGFVELEDFYFGRLASDGAGGVVILGSRETVGGGHLLRLGPDGALVDMPSPDHQSITFGGGLEYFLDVTVTPDGRATVVGVASSDFALARLWL